MTNGPSLNRQNKQAVIIKWHYLPNEIPICKAIPPVFHDVLRAACQRWSHNHLVEGFFHPRKTRRVRSQKLALKIKRILNNGWSMKFERTMAIEDHVYIILSVDFISLIKKPV